MEAEQKLWGEVLNRAILDALWPRLNGGRSDSGVNRREQAAARAWLGHRDAAIVCHLAGVEPEFILPFVRRMIDVAEAERAAFVTRLAGGNGLRGQRSPLDTRRAA